MTGSAKAIHRYEKGLASLLAMTTRIVTYSAAFAAT